MAKIKDGKTLVPACVVVFGEIEGERFLHTAPCNKIPRSKETVSWRIVVASERIHFWGGSVFFPGVPGSEDKTHTTHNGIKLDAHFPDIESNVVFPGKH